MISAVLLKYTLFNLNPGITPLLPGREFRDVFPVRSTIVLALAPYGAFRSAVLDLFLRHRRPA